MTFFKELASLIICLKFLCFKKIETIKFKLKKLKIKLQKQNIDFWTLMVLPLIQKSLTKNI